jgi:ferredoxin-fold anticodon binding domain-containing protein
LHNSTAAPIERHNPTTGDRVAIRIKGSNNKLVGEIADIDSDDLLFYFEGKQFKFARNIIDIEVLSAQEYVQKKEKQPQKIQKEEKDLGR